jgi:hypothetical protein
MPASMAYLAKGRLRLDRLCRNGSALLSSPGLATPRASARGLRFGTEVNEKAVKKHAPVNSF